MLGFALLCSTLQIFLVMHSTKCGPIKAIPKSCLDHLRGGAHSNGFYTVAGPNGKSITVYCDLKSEPGSAWTLIRSSSLENKNLLAFLRKSFSQSAPVNRRTPNWVAYRLSKRQMLYFQSRSSHWRVTCSFDKFKVDYRDYMRGRIKEFDFMRYSGRGHCKKVEYINIRGHARYHVTVPFWQLVNNFSLHTDSSTSSCQYGGAARAGSVGSEDNFGYYFRVNPKFRCTSGPSATTQYWFGGYL
eukprot:gene17725-19497_t